jgi:isocitrate/isopropylmalate dehydrogenase
MMVKQLGEEKYADNIEKAVIDTAIKLDSLSAGKMGMTTNEVGDAVVNSLQNFND